VQKKETFVARWVKPSHGSSPGRRRQHQIALQEGIRAGIDGISVAMLSTLAVPFIVVMQMYCAEMSTAMPNIPYGAQ
jgi:hypothetical protein